MDAASSTCGQVEDISIVWGGCFSIAIGSVCRRGHKGQLSVGTLAAVAAVVGGAGAASAALWWFSRRYVGEMALFTPDLRIVQLSVIDFWGHRQDLKYDVRNIVPPLKGMSNAELEKAANQVLVPLDVVGERQFYLSLRHGRFLQKELLFQLLHGTLDLTNAQSFPTRQQMAPPGTQKVEVEDDSHEEKSSIS